MTPHSDHTEHNTLQQARESFSGRLLTDSQFHEAVAITEILEREIQKSGTFKEKLGDYAYAFARSERFEAAKAETIVRDLFKARTGVTMNQMREKLMEREQALSAEERGGAYTHALEMGALIETGNKISFHRAYAHQAHLLGQELAITDAAAKRLMSEEFKAAENTELYAWGKELEDQFYRPQIEKEKQQRARAQETSAARADRPTARPSYTPESENSSARARSSTLPHRRQTGPSGP